MLHDEELERRMPIRMYPGDVILAFRWATTNHIPPHKIPLLLQILKKAIEKLFNKPKKTNIFGF